MEFKQLEVFVKLYEISSFSQVAKDLNISQPTVSLHLKQLEEELDTPLFVRTTRELKPTKEAARLYKLAVDLIKSRDRLTEQFKEFPPNGISLGVSTIPATYLLPDFLGQLFKESPAIFIRATEANSKDIIEKVAKSEVDLGIVGMKLPNDQCEFHELVVDDFVFIAPANPYYEELKKTKPNLKRLAKEPLIMRESGSGVKHTMEDILRSGGIDPGSLHPVAIMQGIEAIKQLVIKGYGTSFISALAVKNELARGEIISIPITGKEHSRYIYLVWNKNSYQSEVLRDLISRITEYFMHYGKNPEIH